MSPRQADKLVMVPRDGALWAHPEQLEMNYLQCIPGCTYRFMINVLLIMSCSSFAAFAVRTAAGLEQQRFELLTNYHRPG